MTCSTLSLFSAKIVSTMYSNMPCCGCKTITKKAVDPLDQLTVDNTTNPTDVDNGDLVHKGLNSPAGLVSVI